MNCSQTKRDIFKIRSESAHERPKNSLSGLFYLCLKRELQEDQSREDPVRIWQDKYAKANNLGEGQVL